MANAASLVVGKAGGWVRDSLVVSLAPGDLFAYTLPGQGSPCDISYQIHFLGWPKTISLSNLPSAKEGWSKHYFFPLRNASTGGFFSLFFNSCKDLFQSSPKALQGVLDFDAPVVLFPARSLMLQAFVFRAVTVPIPVLGSDGRQVCALESSWMAGCV